MRKYPSRRRNAAAVSVVKSALKSRQPDKVLQARRLVATDADNRQDGEAGAVTADSIRFYQREGLIRPARKSDSGYRLYTDEALRRIGFIKHAQQCGFSLAEIRELLELRAITFNDPPADCS